jgi:hypothetical protein
MTRLSTKMNKGNDGLGNNKKRAAVVSQVSEIIDAHNQLGNIVKNLRDDINERLNNLSIVQRAITEIIGSEKVAEVSRNIRIKMLEDDAAEVGKSLAKAIEEGKLVKTEAVQEETLVVSTIKASDGSQLYPTKNYLSFEMHKPEVQAAIRGKKAGDVLTLPTDGGTIEILDVYAEGVTETTQEPVQA